jgi:hypothetical protein
VVVGTEFNHITPAQAQQGPEGSRQRPPAEKGTSCHASCIGLYQFVKTELKRNVLLTDFLSNGLGN